MHATSKEAGELQPGDLIEVIHEHHDGPPCRCKWDIQAAVVRRGEPGRRSRLDDRAIIGWHDATHPPAAASWLSFPREADP